MLLSSITIDKITRWLYEGVFTGLRALCVQSYTEANVKNGRQRVASGFFNIAQGATLHIGVRTGADPVVIKSRYILLRGGTEIQYFARSDLAFTGEVPGNLISIKNPNNRFKVPILTQMWSAVTPSAPTSETYQYLDPYVIAAAGTNAASRIGSDTTGLDYVLKENTSHVFSIQNTGTGAATVFWWQTLYEGELDLPEGN